MLGCENEMLWPIFFCKLIKEQHASVYVLKNIIFGFKVDKKLICRFRYEPFVIIVEQ